MENQMVRAISFGNCFRKCRLWFKGDAIFLLVLVCSEYLDILCSWSFFCYVKLYSFIFLLKISTQVVCVNELWQAPLHSFENLLLVMAYGKDIKKIRFSTSFSSFS